MSKELERGLEKQKQRYLMLRGLYQLAELGEWPIESFFELGQDAGLSQEEAEEVLLYLEGESLLERSRQGQSVLITDKGVFEVEQLLANPAGTTEHFSALTIRYAEAESPDLVQSRRSEVAAVKQTTGQDKAEFLQLIDALQQRTVALGLEQRDEANEYLEDLRAEITSPAPKTSKLKATLIALWYTGEAFVPFAAQVCELAQELGIHLPAAVGRQA